MVLVGETDTPQLDDGEGNGNPLQYSCLENPSDRGAWPATVHRGAESQTRLKGLRHRTAVRTSQWVG